MVDTGLPMGQFRARSFLSANRLKLPLYDDKKAAIVLNGTVQFYAFKQYLSTQIIFNFNMNERNSTFSEYTTEEKIEFSKSSAVLAFFQTNQRTL
jgi:hypothetical protein